MGMSQPLQDNAAPSSTARLSSKMDFARPSDEADPDRASKSDAVTSMRAGSQQKTKKQSLDYALRTGLAGGVAGCAVCSTPPGSPLRRSLLLLARKIVSLHDLTNSPGQDCRRPSRPGENPLPGLQPAIRQIHRLLVRGRDCDA